MSRKKKPSPEFVQQVIDSYRHHRAALKQFHDAPYSEDLEDRSDFIEHTHHRAFALLALLKFKALDLLAPQERREARNYIAISQGLNDMEMARFAGDKSRPRRVTATWLRDCKILEYLQERAQGSVGGLLRCDVLSELEEEEILPEGFTPQAFTKLIRRLNAEHFFKPRPERRPSTNQRLRKI